MTRKHIFRFFLLVIILLMGGCAAPTASPALTIPPAEQIPTAPSFASITLEQLKNLEFSSQFASSGIARLQDGIFKEPAAPNSASQVLIQLADLFQQGDLDADGNPDAAVLIFSNSGGSGTFVDLAAVLQSPDGPRHAASALLGDRVKVQSIDIDNGIISVRMLTHGADDPMCCPTLEVTRQYQLQPGGLVLIP